MILRHQRDIEILKILGNYKRLRKEHICRFFPDETTKYRIKALLNQKVIVEDGEYLKVNDASKIKYSYNEDKAFEVLLYFIEHFKDKVEHHSPEEYPFTLFFTLNNKLYDVAVIEPGQEDIQCQLINNSMAGRVLIVVENMAQAQKVKSLIRDKELGYITIDNGEVSYYEDA